MKISRHSSATRLTALLLFIVAIISVFSATVYADAASQDTIQKQNVYYGETSLYTSSDYCLSDQYFFSVGTLHLPFATPLSLPTGRAYNDDDNYQIAIDHATSSNYSTIPYKFTGVNPTNSSRNYLKIQKTELCYTPAYQWAEKGLVPSGTKLHEFKYYYISKKAAQYGILIKNAGNKEGAARDQYYTDTERAEIAKRYQKYRDKTDKLYNLGISILGQTKQTVGGYHPQLGMLLGNKGLYGYRNIVAGQEQSAFEWYVIERGFDIQQLDQYLDEVLEDVYQYVETTRITAPEFSTFEIDGSKARIDYENHTVTLNQAFGDNWTAATPVYTTPENIYCELISGSLKNGDNTLVYKLTPYCPYSGVLYNGTHGYTDLSQQWTVTINRGKNPFNDITSFGVKDKSGKMRYGTVQTLDNSTTGNTITLNLSPQTGVSAGTIAPIIQHLGEKVSIQTEAGAWEEITAGTTYDFRKPRVIRVESAPKYKLTTEYTVTVTSNPSSEREILSYQIGQAVGTVDQKNGKISIEIPFAAILSDEPVRITTSDFAKVTSPSSLKVGNQNFYTVTAEDGTTKPYEVTIVRTKPATGNSIVNFSYGAISATINESTGSIDMVVPYGTDLTKLKPSVEVSTFATVSPISGAEVDFSKSDTTRVTYTVTSQSGTPRQYHIKVTKAGKPESAPYSDILKKARENIITLYKSYNDGKDHDGKCGYDDWELMNLGFAECKTPVTPGEALPYGLNIYDHIFAINPTKMTDYGRVIMMLTALGINASNLDSYGDGMPFKDSKGKVVTNLVEELYKFSGSYTINGPIFALIALDMGNYTVPKDAKWTREKLVETILAHPYGSDGFDVDMVAMLMQSLYPYINDPTYGARVKAKMQEGYDIILGYKTAPGVNSMGSDYSFYSWGTTNSESAAQVICAMCAMGVDIGTDPNFGSYSTGDYTKDQGVIPYWLTHFLVTKADGSIGSGFGHADTGFNKMATYESMYALQWYLNFYENGGADGIPYSLYAGRFDFARALSKECSITKFVLEGQEGTIRGDSIEIRVPDEMPLNNLTPEVTVSEGAKLIAPKLPATFVAEAPTAFTVQAEDGTSKKTYAVTPVYDASVKGKGTTLFTDTIQIQNEDLADKDMEDMQVTKNDDGTTDILITIVPGVDTTKLRFKADISYKATASIDVTGKSNVDLHDWTDVVITAEDGTTTAKYRIKVVSQTFASITEFVIKVDGVEYGAEIKATGATGTIRFTGIPDTADLTRVTPTKITLGEGTTEVLPSASAPQNFAEGAEYTVKGEGLRTRTYSVVTSSKGGGGDDGDDTPTVNRSFAITSFKIGDTAAEIDDKNGIIKITLPYGTNLYQQAPKIETGSGCTVSPRSGQVVNLSLPVTYTLTRGDETRTYTVIVTLKKSASQLIWDKAAVKLNPSSYQTSPDLGKKEPERTYIPSTSQILSGMKVQVNGKDVTYQASGVSNWLTMTPDSYSAASTYRFRAEKGALKNIAANGYNGFGIQAGKLHIGITEKMDTARGLDLSLCPVPAAAQTAWKNKSGVVGVWKLTCDSVSGGLTLTFDCAGQTGKLALAKYNEAKKCFEQVSEKKWSVSGSILTASNMSAGIYGVIKIG